jgi:hypothetical protein
VIEKNITSYRNSIMTLPAFNLEKPPSSSEEILALVFRPRGSKGSMAEPAPMRPSSTRSAALSVA